MMLQLRCDQCRWWDAVHTSLAAVTDSGVPGIPWVLGALGYCRKHKPLVYSAKDHYWCTWPISDAAGFCGEYMPDPPKAG